MTAFIKQEAMEKAREIEIKANEEFEIEKSKLVREETDAIDTQYEKKFKQATMSQQITRSTVSNKTRLRVLSARQDLLDSLFEEAEKQLAAGTKDKSKYQATLKGLILEGFYALNEPEMQVRARKADYDVVKKAIGEAEKEYKKEVGKDVKGSIDEENPLSENSCVASPGCYRLGWGHWLTGPTELVVCTSLAEMERSTSTTLSRRDSSFSRIPPVLPCQNPSSARTLTAASPTKKPSPDHTRYLHTRQRRGEPGRRSVSRGGRLLEPIFALFP